MSKKFLQLLGSILASLGILIWLFQASISNSSSTPNFIKQPLKFLESFKVWTLGADLSAGLNSGKEHLSQAYNNLGDKANLSFAEQVLGNAELASQSLQVDNVTDYLDNNFRFPGSQPGLTADSDSSSNSEEAGTNSGSDSVTTVGSGSGNNQSAGTGAGAGITTGAEVGTGSFVEGITAGAIKPATPELTSEQKALHQALTKVGSDPETAILEIHRQLQSQKQANSKQANLEKANSAQANENSKPANSTEKNSSTPSSTSEAEANQDSQVANSSKGNEASEKTTAGATTTAATSEPTTTPTTSTTANPEVNWAKLYPHTLPANRFAIGKLDNFAGPLDYTQYSFPPQALPVVLTKGDQILIVGDSMQQGVGRHIRSYLSSNYKIYSKDLAKQSTGLISPTNLDWNKTIAKELKANKKYKLMVMMIGANDNFGIYNPNTKKAYPWGTKEWQAFYLQRVMSIMYQARTNNVSLIWITVPNVRNKDLNEKIQLINKLVTQAASQYGVTVVSANQALGMSEDKFITSVLINNQVRKTRSDDGTHFTVTGEKLIAGAVQDLIHVQTVTTASSSSSTNATAKDKTASTTPTSSASSTNSASSANSTKTSTSANQGANVETSSPSKTSSSKTTPNESSNASNLDKDVANSATPANASTLASSANSTKQTSASGNSASESEVSGGTVNGSSVSGNTALGIASSRVELTPTPVVYVFSSQALKLYHRPWALEPEAVQIRDNLRLLAYQADGTLPSQTLELLKNRSNLQTTTANSEELPSINIDEQQPQQYLSLKPHNEQQLTNGARSRAKFEVSMSPVEVSKLYGLSLPQVLSYMHTNSSLAVYPNLFQE